MENPRHDELQRASKIGSCFTKRRPGLLALPGNAAPEATIHWETSSNGVAWTRAFHLSDGEAQVLDHAQLAVNLGM
jgi:hypothetical protein